MFKHWTYSNIKGCQEFNDIELLKLWQNGLYKGYFNESNWVKKRSDNDGVLAGDYKTPYSVIPLFLATNKIAVIVVNVGTDSTFAFPDLQFKIYDPDTNDEILTTEYTGKSSTPITMSMQSNGNYKYLSWAYSVLVLTGGETYTNDDGFPLKQRVIASLQYGDGGKFTTFDENISDNYYFKFIEMGSGFTSEVLPTFNQPLPANFLTAFVEMINGVMTGFGDGGYATAKRHTNYLLPSPIRNINIGNSEILKSLILRNDANSSLTSNNYYSIAKLVTHKNVNYSNNFVDGDGIRLQAGYVNQNNVGSNVVNKSKTDANISYTNWKEFNLIGDDSAKFKQSIYENVKNPKLIQLIDSSVKYKNEVPASSPPEFTEVIDFEVIRNLACSSMLPGFSETLLTNLYEFYRPPVTSTVKPAINNVFLSVIKATLELPFWKYPVNNDVVEIATDITIFKNDEFDMYLKIESDASEDIIDNDVNLFVKFII